MSDSTTIQGSEGEVFVRTWENPDAKRIVLIAHGYGEHIGRYEHVADALVADGAAVYGPDHIGHGQTTVGDRAVIGVGSVVTRDVPVGVVAAGNPCRVVREL